MNAGSIRNRRIRRREAIRSSRRWRSLGESSFLHWKGGVLIDGHAYRLRRTMTGSTLTLTDIYEKAMKYWPEGRVV